MIRLIVTVTAGETSRVTEIEAEEFGELVALASALGIIAIDEEASE